MKPISFIKSLFGMLGKFVSLIEGWISIAFDWTEEIKESSDEALKRYKLEREAEDAIALHELEQRLAKRKKELEENE